MDLQKWVKKGREKISSLGIKEWGMVLLVGLCCLIIVFPVKKQEEAEEKRSEPVQHGINKIEETDYVVQLENRLSNLLCGVENVGNVKVMITVNGTVRKNILQDGSHETEEMTETDSAGGSRNSVNNRSDGTTVFAGINGENTPYILSEDYPEITGVVVIAEGSGTGTVDLDILHAVQVLFDVPAHKIKIMKMK